MKNVFTWIMAMGFSFACNQPATAPANASASTNNNQKWVDQYFLHFNNHDWAKMAAMYADPAEFKDPSLGPGVIKQTRQQTIHKYTELNQLFPDLHDQVIQVYEAGDQHIIVEFISTGTGPDSSTFELPICTIFTIENGLITKDYTYYDNLGDQPNAVKPE
jgi:ketosteroid isomerase-like protein